MAFNWSSVRRRLLYGVIVLLVFYPIGLYFYTQAVDHRIARETILDSIDDALDCCEAAKSAIQELLSGAEGDLGGENGEPNGPRRAELERKLQLVLYRCGVSGTSVRFLQVYKGTELLLHEGGDAAARLLDDVVVTAAMPRRAIRDRLFEAGSRGATPGICQVTFPLDLGSENSGRLVTGIEVSSISSQLGALSERLSMRALRLSLVGTSLLALVAIYIIHLNERTRKLELKLEEEKRLAYVGTIAAGMVHEIRNPLSSVKMNIQMIEDKLGEFGEKESGYLVNKVARIRRETARLEESVNNFLAFARPKPLKRRWADLNEAVGHVIEFLEPICVRDGIRVVRDFSPDLPQVYIDPEQLGQAVENLIRNAHQAIGKDGIIEIYTGRHGDYVEIRVSDTGPGISADVQDRIFEVFYTTKEGGSGLGLTIVKQIAEAHGGGVSFDTIEKRGTTFTIGIPIEPKI